MTLYTPQISEIRAAYYISKYHPDPSQHRREEDVYPEFDRAIAKFSHIIWEEGFVANSMEVIDSLGLTKEARDLAVKNLMKAAVDRNPYPLPPE